MVTAQEVTAQLKIPRQALYRLVRLNRIPYRDVTEAWHQRRQYRFCLEEVRAALDEPGRPRRPPPPA